jgi:predicted RNA binding protein YcfA (HicA-like mRNA interferase family)
MLQFLERRGFVIVRIRGSYHVVRQGDLRTTVPVHGNQNLRIGTLRGILRDIDISPAEFERLWDRRA